MVPMLVDRVVVVGDGVLMTIASEHSTFLKVNSPTVMFAVDKNLQVELLISEQPFSSKVSEDANESVRTLYRPSAQTLAELLICKRLSSTQQPLHS